MTPARHGYDVLLRRTNLTAQGSSVLARALYGYDGASRLSSVSDGTNEAAYLYVGNSPLAGQITFSQNGATKMTTTKTYDYLNRLTAISSSAGASNISSFSYQYNNANQRTKATPVDGSYWVYSYDSLGQVTGGKKYWSDGTPVAGQQFDYTFDTIGNRTQTQAGGDQTGANLRTANYTNNGLNQITSRSVPEDVDIMGLGFATNAMTVNGQAAYRKGEYFRDQVGVTNTSAPIWQNVTVPSPGQGSVAGCLFVPQTPEQFSYDADGNLLQDGRWTYVWDGENRLINMTSLTNAPAGSKLKLDFAYDYMGRRIQKIVSTNNGLAYIGQSTNLYLYDGWNLVVELGAGGSLVRSYLWGADVSGSLQGAGGVGGLLEMSYYGSSTTNCFVAYDGNGNVSALVNAANGGPLGFYEYGPFGEVIRETGPMAKVNPFRFSTKFDDDETDLAYYGCRYYNPSTGRWLSRDPLLCQSPHVDNFHEDENEDPDSSTSGGEMVFVANNPISNTDPFGLWLSSSYFWDNLILGGPVYTAHENAIIRKLPDVFYTEMGAWVNDAIRWVDDSQNQGTDPQSTAKHAMSSPGEPQSVARALANAWVRRNMLLARDSLCSCQHEDDKLGGWYFGLALHTVQDSISPAHWGFQVWLGYGVNYWNDQAALHHVREENFDPGAGSQLDQATSDLYKLLDCNTPLPSDFFHYRADRRGASVVSRN